MLMYGQTGRGKTFTMSAIYERAAVNLLANTGDRMVTVNFIELLGDQLFDMLNGGAPCQCMTGTDGAAFPQRLLLMLELACKLRATAAQRRCGWRCLREELR